jgi:phospholipid-binding lipoprotein MlaA
MALWFGRTALIGVYVISACLLIVPAVACADSSSDSDAQKTLNPVKKTEETEVDPYEDFNRSMYSFNNHLDNYLAKPISDAYLWATPDFLKTGVSNFFSNLKDINVVLNDNMQGKFEQGFEDTGRFIANSTFGLLGVFDVASEIGLTKHVEDFGQTLAVWGVPRGAYLVLPILGPTTSRGLPGSVFDVAANPSTYVGAPIQLVSMLNTRANADGAIKFVNDAAIDPYVFTREAYLQNLQHLISDGKLNPGVDVLPLEDQQLDKDLDAAMAEDADKTSKTPTTDQAKKSVEPLPEKSAYAAASSEAQPLQKPEKSKKKHSRKHRGTAQKNQTQ